MAAPSRDIPTSRGPWGGRMGDAPAVLGTQSGTAGSRGKSGDFQRTKRLLAAGIAGGGRASSRLPLQLGLGKGTKKHQEFVFYLPGNPGPVTGPGQNTLVESSGQAQQHPICVG